MTITDIESLTYEQAKEIAIEMIMIKDHDCFFADLGRFWLFRFMYLKMEGHIYFANDYELHHGYMVKTGREGIIKRMDILKHSVVNCLPIRNYLNLFYLMVIMKGKIIFCVIIGL